MAVLRSSRPLGLAGRARLAAVKPAGIRAPNGRRSCTVAAAMPIAEVASIAGAFTKSLTPTAEYFNTLGLPEPLIHWGHPGNMAVVLLAMGGYGSWLGWQIRTSDNGELIAKAKDLHPKLLGGAFFFFALGASGGMMSLIMQGKPILESPHATTGFIGLGLLAVQAMLPLFFSESAGSRTVHAFLGTGIMGLLFFHMFLGLQLGLSI